MVVLSPMAAGICSKALGQGGGASCPHRATSPWEEPPSLRPEQCVRATFPPIRGPPPGASSAAAPFFPPALPGSRSVHQQPASQTAAAIAVWGGHVTPPRPLSSAPTTADSTGSASSALQPHQALPSGFASSPQGPAWSPLTSQDDPADRHAQPSSAP